MFLFSKINFFFFFRLLFNLIFAFYLFLYSISTYIICDHLILVSLSLNSSLYYFLSYRLHSVSQQLLIKNLLFMNQNFTINTKPYELSPRYNSKALANNFIKPKLSQTISLLSPQEEDIITDQSKITIQPPFLLNTNLNKNKKTYEFKPQSSQRNNLSNYKTFQPYESNKNSNQQLFNDSKLKSDDTASVRFYQPVTPKNQIGHYNSTKLLSSNKLNLTSSNLGRNLSPINNVNSTQINNHQRKNSSKGENLHYKHHSTIELLNSIKKSNQIIAEAQNITLTKRKSAENADNQNQTQTNNKKMPRFSEPGFFSINGEDQANNSNDDAISECRTDYPNEMKNRLYYSNHDNISKYSSFNNPQKKYPQFQTNQAFKKQKQLNIHINLNGNQKIRSPRSYIIQNNERQKQIPKISDFIKGKQLGSGKFGTVNIVMHKKTGFVCALKTIPKIMIKQQNIINQFVREIKIQSCLDHPNITKLYGFFDDKNYIYLLLELGSEGQLFKLLKQKKRFSENLVIYFIKQLCEALKYLHSLNIIHRDIKPENIVIQYGAIKLCDFGWAVNKGGQLRSTFCGTPLYVSPEILKGQLYDQKIDIWSVGILTYQLLVGAIPFQITSEQQLIKIIKQDIVFPTNLNISNQAKDFVLKILKKNPDERLKVGKLLQHPFLQRNIELSQLKF